MLIAVDEQTLPKTKTPVTMDDVTKTHGAHVAFWNDSNSISSNSNTSQQQTTAALTPTLPISSTGGMNNINNYKQS